MTPSAPQLRRLVLRSPAPEATRHLGRRMGERLRAGQVVALHGPLGIGKTCLVQGLARGLGVAPEIPVTSPSYTLLNEYPGRVALLHFDLYRLGGIEDAEAIGFFERLGGPEAAVVEWAERIPPAALGPHLAVDMALEPGGGRRLILVGDRESFGELLAALEGAGEEEVSAFGGEPLADNDQTVMGD